ncbi:hypothetical protein [Sinomonas halotolerans]|uniref:DUF559 domain-containing protein n=1 Tax=Sinomonas halotolerans TaxID=1644133 RepID=A0ABU9X2W2_9MICC
MTTDPTPASAPLDRPFTSSEAASLGFSYRDLLKEDVRHVSRELYIPRGTDHRLVDRLRAHLAVAPGGWGSHRTAAAIHGLWLPESAGDHRLLHVSRKAGGQRVRRTGVVGHRVRVLPEEIETVAGGVHVTTPARTWFDMAHELGPVALTAMGDQLIRKPRSKLECRAEPYATTARLTEMLRAHPNVKGLAKLRAALADMRVGSDSIPETLLRLALLAYGFPEPELQIALRPFDPFSPTGDMGYPEIRVVLQYEGAHHREEDQQLKDARRDAAFRAAGWIVIHVTAEDLRDDFDRIRRELRVLFSKRAA